MTSTKGDSNATATPTLELKEELEVQVVPQQQPEQEGPVTPATVDSIRWPNHSNIVYGHAHLAKTAGTTLNCEMAIRFERVCGNRVGGNSFDAYHVNDLADAIGGGFIGNRPYRPDDIGLQNCDWISSEATFNYWKEIADELNHNHTATESAPKLQLEIHVPCREPIDFLLSMTNYQRQSFNCTHANTVSVEEETFKHVIYMERFRENVWQQWKQDSNNDHISMKCFNPIPINNYLHYMATKSTMQPRRMTRNYVHQATNRDRTKETECLLEDANAELREKVIAVLQQKEALFRFCKECTGSKDDLLAQS